MWTRPGRPGTSSPEGRKRENGSKGTHRSPKATATAVLAQSLAPGRPGPCPRAHCPAFLGRGALGDSHHPCGFSVTLQLSFPCCKGTAVNTQGCRPTGQV